MTTTMNPQTNEMPQVQVIDFNAMLDARAKASTTIVGPFKNVFHYAAFCDSNFQHNMEMRGADLQDTTFTNDLAIAEYCEQMGLDNNKTTEAVEDTIKRATAEWKHDPDYIIALIFAVNAKSWEHHAMASAKYAHMRAFTKEIHEEYAKYYTERYYTLLDHVMDELYAGEENEEIRMQIYNAID